MEREETLHRDEVWLHLQRIVPNGKCLCAVRLRQTEKSQRVALSLRVWDFHNDTLLFSVLTTSVISRNPDGKQRKKVPGVE